MIGPKDMKAAIENGSIPVPEAGCWLWLGTSSIKNYGIVSLGVRGRKAMAHRASWEAFNGRQIPRGLLVCHKCDTPPCVNPDHLFVGTILDNNRDRQAKGGYIGERNGRARLTPAQVLAIRASSESQAVAGKRFGVGASTIRDIRRRTTWAHIRNGDRA